MMVGGIKHFILMEEIKELYGISLFLNTGMLILLFSLKN
ncbi:Uncharacterised protein [Enterobacter hormaechei]|nr:Uncharacterised protein [Enterobacter hormaechei]